MWHPVKNEPVEPWDVKANSSQKLWWKGECGHEWEMEAAHMAAGAGCPFCRGHQVLSGTNDLATLFPKIAAQWHPELNGDLHPSDLRAHSNRDAWWLCGSGHAWRATVNNRTSHDAGCPVCAKREVAAGVNDLATTHRKLARQWHPTMNGDLTPKDVTSISSKKVWWRCRHGHEWQAIVSRRAGDHDPGCPYCAGRKAWPGFNDLATLRPDLAAEWHPFRNGKLTPADVTPGSNKTVWWRAGCGHVFELKVCVRARAKEPSCPYCSGKKVPERPIRILR